MAETPDPAPAHADADPATLAFEALREEVALVRRAVAGLAASVPRSRSPTTARRWGKSCARLRRRHSDGVPAAVADEKGPDCARPSVCADQRGLPHRRAGSFAGFVDNDAACLHHPTYFADGHLDVGKGIAFDGNDIGDIAGRDQTQRLLHTEHFGR
jgi:hypothetical protein